MKTTLLLLAIFYSLNSTAQRFNEYQSELYELNRMKNKKDSPFYFQQQWVDKLGESHKKKITKTISFSNPKKKHTTVYHLNENNKIREINWSKYTQKIYYINDTMVSRIETISKKPSNTEITYVNGNKIKEETWRDEKLIVRKIAQFDEHNQLIFSMIDSKKGNFSMYYNYIDRQLENQKFIKNDKVLKSWDYTCSPEGKDVKSKVESQICRYNETNLDGSYVSYSRTLEKGKILLFKSYFTKDSVFYGHEVFKNDTLLISKTEYSNGKNVTISYGSKGQVTSITTTEFNGKNQIIKRERKNGKKEKNIIIELYEYNDQGDLIAEKRINKSKEVKTVSYTYEY